MPDRKLTPRWRWGVRIARSCAYSAVGLFGMAGIIYTPKTTASAVGVPLIYWWSILATFGAGIAVYGVLAGRYRYEWIGTWPAAGASLMYAITVWNLMSEGETGRMAQAFLATGLFLFLAARGLDLAAHAHRLREEHTDEIDIIKKAK